MTREEAITELNVIYERLSHPEDCENGVYSFRDGDYLEALNMAINALTVIDDIKAEILDLTTEPKVDIAEVIRVIDKHLGKESEE